jgi:predicted acylesterase/phospholipase RssA
MKDIQYLKDIMLSFDSIDLRPLHNKKVTFVTSGGVVKAGAWHLGVALALHECGFTFSTVSNPKPQQSLSVDSYVGSSAGSLINLYLASGHRPKEIINAFLSNKHSDLKPIGYKEMLSLKRPEVPKRKRINKYNPFSEFPAGIRHLIKPIAQISGLFTTEGLQKYLQEYVITSNRFEDYPDMFVTATQLDHSRKYIFSKYKYPNPRHDNTAYYKTGVDITKAIAASMSVPPFYAPYPIHLTEDNTEYFIDGEIRETLSTHVAYDNKADYVISSWTHTPYHFHDEIGSLVNYGIPAIAMQSIYLLIQKKIIADRAQRKNYSDLFNIIYKYLNDNNFDSVHKKKIMTILEQKLNHDPKVKLIDIYPTHDDYKIFFTSSFSFNKDNTAHLVNRGFKRALQVLEKLDL